jgi:uncharacterized protein (TIGR00255 family)
MIEVAEEDEHEEDRRAAEAAVIAGFALVVTELAAMRRHEGSALGQILKLRLDEIATLAARAEAAPGRRPEAIKARIAEQIAVLLDASGRFDPDRLHQEAILIASKADIREELDRLAAHVNQATRMIADGGAIGRRLDFLAQELNREANTLCAKSNDVELTNIGLELKSVVGPEPGMSRCPPEMTSAWEPSSRAAGSCWSSPRPRAPARPRSRGFCLRPIAVSSFRSRSPPGRAG